MEKQAILVTGASGQQGGSVARILLKNGFPVRAMSRNTEKIKDLEQLGAETVSGDLGNLFSLEKALSGIKKAFLVTTPFETGMESEVQQGINFIDASKKVGLEHLVFTSVAAANLNTGIPHFETKKQIEQYLGESGIPFTILRPVFFMENFGSPWFLPSIKEGKLVLPVHEDVSLQMIPLEVIGKFALAAFQRPEEFLGKAIEIASDQLTFPQAMEKLSQASGKAIGYRELPERDSLETFGDDFTRMFQWFNDNGFDIDFKHLGKLGVHLTTFDEHLKEADWVQNV